MKTVIFAGGFGTRIASAVTDAPKPMIEIGGTPILFRIMDSFARQGFDDFIIALGYKAEVIRDYFVNFQHRYSDINVNLSDGSIEVISGSAPRWRVALVDTGVSTMTGGRLKRLGDLLDSTFMVTYGDGLSNVNLRKLLDFHHQEDSLLTVTAVNPASRYGRLDIDQRGRVLRFQEKPEFSDSWVNGGFMVAEPEVLQYSSGDHSVFESETMPKIADLGRMAAYRHRDFWHSMDTLRDKADLESIIASGQAPWEKAWP